MSLDYGVVYYCEMSFQALVAGFMDRLLSPLSGRYAQAAMNFRAECRLPHLFWEKLNSGIQACQTPVCLKEAVGTHCRQWILKGPEVTLDKRQRLGRAVGMDAYSSFLSPKYFGTARGARSAIRRLPGKPAHIVARRWERYPLGRHVLWATFAENPEKSPFDELRSAWDVKCRLGLSDYPAGTSLILLEYTLPEQAPARIPTVADAYAGEWYYFFRPAPPGEMHGRAMPWDECKDFPPLPEVVHEVISGARLRHVTEMLN